MISAAVGLVSVYYSDVPMLERKVTVAWHESHFNNENKSASPSSN